jgi:hypothetical protein
LPTLKQPDLWAEMINKCKQNTNRYLGEDIVDKSVYNINNVVSKLMDIYCIN